MCGSVGEKVWVSVWVRGSGCRRGVWARGCVGVWVFFSLCVCVVFEYVFLNVFSLSFFKSLKSLKK